MTLRDWLSLVVAFALSALSYISWHHGLPQELLSAPTWILLRISEVALACCLVSVRTPLMKSFVLVELLPLVTRLWLQSPAADERQNLWPITTAFELAFSLVVFVGMCLTYSLKKVG